MQTPSVSGVLAKTKVFAFKYANYELNCNLLKIKVLYKYRKNDCFLCCSLRRKGIFFTP